MFGVSFLLPPTPLEQFPTVSNNIAKTTVYFICRDDAHEIWMRHTTLDGVCTRRQLHAQTETERLSVALAT